MIYKIFEIFFQNDFIKDIEENIDRHSNNLIVFDVGCYIGSFSKKLKKKISNKQIDFYLFDPNPNLKIEGFKFNNIALSNKKGNFDYHLNTFFPSSGSSLNTKLKDDRLWNFTRKLVSFSLKKNFLTFKVNVDLLDNFCEEKKINHIDVLKIDVEGSELEVLQGATNILKNTKIIQIEIFDKKELFQNKLLEIKKILTQNNFKLKKIKSVWSSKTLSTMECSDALFIKNDI